MLSFVTAPDFESVTSYTFTVVAFDGLFYARPVTTITINDVNEAPSITSGAAFSVAENETAIGTVTATDPESDTLTFSVSGSDLAIDSSTGVLTFASAPDFETTSSVTATVTVSDGSLTDTQEVTVTVTDVNEAPSITSSASFSADENQTAIGTVT